MHELSKIKEKLLPIKFNQRFIDMYYPSLQIVSLSFSFDFLKTRSIIINIFFNNFIIFILNINICFINIMI